MSKSLPKSFGAQLLKAQSLVTVISGFTNYRPPRNEETAAAVSALLDEVVENNGIEIIQQENYRRAVDARHKAFWLTADSVERTIAALRNAVESQYGKPSPELTMIESITRRMNSHKKMSAPAAGGDPAQEENTRTLSQTERSYGSVTKFFNDIINCLTQFPDFAPANDKLKIEGLKARASDLNAVNTSVTQTRILLQNSRIARRRLYLDLDNRVKRIRAYVRAEYGARSEEVRMISQLAY